jgi:hypothetical protein
MKTQDVLKGDEIEQASKGEGKQEGEQEGSCQNPDTFDKQTKQTPDNLCPQRRSESPGRRLD